MIKWTLCESGVNQREKAPKEEGRRQNDKGKRNWKVEREEMVKTEDF